MLNKIDHFLYNLSVERFKKKALKNKSLLTLLLAYTGFFIFMSLFYYQRLGAFGCFDDCFYYMGGYFLLKEKQIYTDFFFNHSFIIPYISFIIQKITTPETVYSFILYHKAAVFLFSFISGLFLIYRFRAPAFFALIFFEMTKFYTFGDRFLGESFVVYPIMYLLGLVWEKANGRALKIYDFILAGFFAWFCIFSREPFAPLTLFLFFILMLGKKDLRFKTYAVISFLIPTALSFLIISPKDFYINVITYNKSQVLAESEKSGGLSAILLYPLKIFIEEKWNLFRFITIFFMSSFLISGIFYFIKLRRIGFILLLISLGLAAVRPIDPGHIYFEAYRMNIWLGLLIFSTFLIIFEFIMKKVPNLKFYFTAASIFLFLFILFSQSYFIWEKVNKIEEFNTSYAHYYAYGNAIKILADKSNTLFLEGRDELIYPITGLESSYKYNGYTSFMPLIEKYRSERKLMFEKNPPDFYYDSCFQLDKYHKVYSPEILKQYERFYLDNGKPSCLLVKKSVLLKIPEEKINSVKQFGFTLNVDY